MLAALPPHPFYIAVVSYLGQHFYLCLRTMTNASQEGAST
jgi:hypothetical protein